MDPLISLAFALQSNKGVYALLLGSGISKPAQIPTGWDIVIDLIGRTAALRGDDKLDDPGGWYRNTFGKDADYSSLLDALAKTQAERQQLLRAYFEPNEQDREEGLKKPTAAHQSIASLVARGYVKVILTTNFDRLTEQALEIIGIIPTVISNSDQLHGAIPLQHSNCTIIKINGDYVDSRIRNTTAELENYEPEMEQLLDRVFDEYGLIICGWSGEWDIALRRAIERCKSRRFTTYWTSISEAGDKAKRIITNRQGQLIRVESADTFFTQLEEKVTALEDMAHLHPLSARIAVATLKRYLVDDKHKIALHDLVMGETQRLVQDISDERFPLGADISSEELARRVRLYDGLTSTLLALFKTGCYWGGKENTYLWTKSILQIANRSQIVKGSFYEPWRTLRWYPALLLEYGGGISALANHRYENLAALLLNAKVPIRPGDVAVSLTFVLAPGRVLERRVAQLLPGMERHYVPLSDWLFSVLKEPLVEILGSEEDYTAAFDLFEAYLTMVFSHFSNKADGGVWAPFGRYGWKFRYDQLANDAPLRRLKDEVEAEGANWGALQAGFFDGSLERCQEVLGWLPEISKTWERELLWGG